MNLFLGTVQEYAAQHTDNRYDVVLVDGDHSEAAVRVDLLVVSKLTSTILAHDYNVLHAHPGVTIAVDEFLRTNQQWKIVSQVGSLLLMRTL
jgi:hypothetical protein